MVGSELPIGDDGMSTETCAICETVTPFEATVHVMFNATYAEGVDDYYICRTCFEERVAPLIASRDADEEGDTE